jgi:hypothetical protein
MIDRYRVISNIINLKKYCDIDGNISERYETKVGTYAQFVNYVQIK